VALLSTVTFLRATITISASLAGLAVLTTETIGGNISSIGQSTVAEALLTTSTAIVDLVSTPAGTRAAIAIARVETDLAICATLAVKGDVAGRTTFAKVGGTVVTAVGSRVATPPLGGTTIAKGTATTNEFVCTATRTVRSDASWA
jgi:hypothetical protein